MKIQFIRPKPPQDTIGLQHIMIVEPLELEILATLVKDKHEIEIIDMILEENSLEYYIERFNPDVICVTGYITHTSLMIDTCARAKAINSHIVTIVGGVHVEKLPDTLNDSVIDYRVVRNAVKIFPELINTIENRAKHPSGVLCFNEQMIEEELPAYDFKTIIPDRNIISHYRDRYFYLFHDKVALLKTSFGCPFNCNFCYCRGLTGNQYYERSMDDVFEELLAIDEKEIYIVDDDFLVSEKRVTDFMDKIEEHNVDKRYLIYGRSDFIIKNPDLLRRFKNLGLRSIIVGLESFEDKDLSLLNKNTTGNMNEQTMNVLNDIGIDCYACIIAMPDWTHETFEHMTKKLIDLKIHFVNIQPITPLLKTDLKFDDSKLIIPRSDYAKWDLAHVVVEPEHMSEGEFYENILKMYDRILFRPSNIIYNIKYPLKAQLKLFSGAIKVRNQYKEKILNSSYSYA